MELTKTTFNGHKVDVIFNGPIYLFYNSYAGFIAAAYRSHEDKNGEHFLIKIGNRHTVGGSLTDSVVLSYVQRFIRKAEQRYIPKNVDFIVDYSADLADAYLDLSDGFKIR